MGEKCLHHFELTSCGKEKSRTHRLPKFTELLISNVIATIQYDSCVRHIHQIVALS